MTNFIEAIVKEDFPDCWQEVMQLELIQYLVYKTRSVHRSSKARASYANLYAIYVLVEDYVNGDFARNPSSYASYEGMQFSDAFRRQRELPFGEKLQNHALNHRCNQEFLKYFPHLDQRPIIRDLNRQGRYWINDALLQATCQGSQENIAHTVIRIVDRYVELRRESFLTFFEQMQNLAETGDKGGLEELIRQQLSLSTDARTFEIVSYALVKLHYERQAVYVGTSPDHLEQIQLVVYKTGRTNANDGGIDFIMQPLGRIFQVTEVLDFNKYFLDIDKLNRYPISFVIKVDKAPENVRRDIEAQAKTKYADQTVREKYLACFDEIITIPKLVGYLEEIIEAEQTYELVSEIVLQCKVEFNIHDLEK